MMASISDCSKQPRIFLWCWPRAISTCFLKCLSFVEGVQVWHEPYQIPHSAEVIRHLTETGCGKAMETLMKEFVGAVTSATGEANEFSGGRLMPDEKFTYPWIKSALEEEEPDKKYIIIKDTAYAIYENPEWLPEVPSRHTFIIRHPYLLMTSHRKVHMRMSNFQGDPSEFEYMSEMADQLYNKDYMYLLWKMVKDSGKDPSPIIIDAEDLMNYPEKVLKKYLEALGIPFKESYTNWDESEESIKSWKGGRDYVAAGKRLGIFDKAFRSSCFLPKNHVMLKREDLTPDIIGIVDRIMPGYEKMYQYRLKPE